MRRIVAAVVLLLAATALVTWAQVAGPMEFQWISVEEDIKIGDEVFLSQATDGGGEHFRVTIGDGYMEQRDNAGGFLYQRTDATPIGVDFAFSDMVGNSGVFSYFGSLDSFFISDSLWVSALATVRLTQFASCPVNLDSSGDMECLTLGSGISYTTGDLDIDLNETLDGVGSTSTLSGMEMTATDELALLQGCDDAEVLVWNDTTATWECGVGAPAGTVENDDAGPYGTSYRIAAFDGTDARKITGSHVTGTQPTIETSGAVSWPDTTASTEQKLLEADHDGAKGRSDYALSATLENTIAQSDSFATYNGFSTGIQIRQDTNVTADGGSAAGTYIKLFRSAADITTDTPDVLIDGGGMSIDAATVGISGSFNAAGGQYGAGASSTGLVKLMHTTDDAQFQGVDNMLNPVRVCADASATTLLELINASGTDTCIGTANTTFDNDGNITMSGRLELTPQSSAPATCDGTTEGSIYYDSDNNTVCVCGGGGPAWLQVGDMLTACS